MAGSNAGIPAYLTSNQQELLRAALVSNQTTSMQTAKGQSNGKSSLPSKNHNPFENPALYDTMFASPQQLTRSGVLGTLDYDNTPFLDSLDGDNSFDLETADVDGQAMFGALTGDSDESAEATEKHSKRKNSADGDDEQEDPDHKRREGDDKVAKKPGRKPITTEPTTVCCPAAHHVPSINNDSEAQGTEPCCSKSVPRSQRATLERP